MRKILFTMLAVTLLVAFAAAQTPTGKFVGKVKDDQGAPLPGVSVEATSPKLVGKAVAVTDETGTYRLFTLPSGTYVITFTLQGFQPVKREGVVLQLEQTISLDISLKQSTLAEEITVLGKSPLIDVKSTSKGSTMTAEVFMQLPRNRSFDGLLSTVPGVQYEGNQGGLSVDGASGTENMWYIDGTNVNGIHVGLRNQGIVMEQLEEVKVTASGYNAEFGGSMGGVVNVISRSGGNEFHGDLFGYYNNAKLWMQGKAREYLRLDPYIPSPYVAQYVNDDDLYFGGGKNRDDYQRYEGVFNLGGYIIKDRLWFFGSFNPVYARTYADRWFRGDPVNLAAATLPGNVSLDPRQGRQLYTGFYNKNYNYNWQAKMTIAPFKGMRISLSAVSNFSYYRGSIPSVTGTGTVAYSYFPDWQFAPALTKGQQPGFDYPNLSGAAVIDYTVSNNFLVSVRGGLFRQNTTNQQLFVPGTYYAFDKSNMNLWPGVIPDNQRHDQGWSNGAGTSVTAKYIMEKISANLDFTFYMNLAGEHAWKAGVQYIRLHEDVNSGPQSPLVNIAWDDVYGLPNGDMIRGTYGYYTIRGDWVSPYGSIWNIHSDNWAIYLQDSWTIGDRLTFNFGLRTESEYIPPFDPDPKWASYKPIQFGFDKKLAPRLGLVYDVFGDSSLKVFGSFGIYYDVMKLYMAEGAYGGFLWWTSLYELNDPDYTKIAASGKINDKDSQTVGGVNTYRAAWNNRTTSFDTTDPNLKPVSQSELSFGAEKKISEELSFSARFVYKHLIRTIEDVGVLMPNAYGGEDEQYYIANPGEGWTQSIGTGDGRFDARYWPAPKPKREYYALNLALEKRFSNNWQGGVNYTWSQMKGNYGGLSSSDEGGRNSPNVERYWDLWYERYDLHGKPLDGIQPSDRTHYIKIYGSYAFPFGLTVGVVGYGRSGLPLTTQIGFSRMPVYPENYFDTGRRLPFTAWADVYVEYNLRIAKKYSVNLNATISNITNTSTIQGEYMRPNYRAITWTFDQILSQTLNWKDYVAGNIPDPRYGLWTSKYGPWSWRMGARFSF
jgi:hypothetical protein